MNAPPLTPAHLRALLRRDFGFYCRGAMSEMLGAVPLKWNWHLDLIANHLEDVIEGRTRRLIINIPPRYGKSLIASVALPSFIHGRDPRAEIVCVSYSQDLADKMASDTRRLMNSDWYQSVFPARLNSPRSRLSELRTSAGGTRLATSVGGMLTGRGGNIIIIDDPLKPSEAASETERQNVNSWFDSTATTRANDKERGAIVVIMQRLHEDDLVGHLLQQGHWELLSLPAIAETDERHEIRSFRGKEVVVRNEGEPLHPDRESLARLLENRAVMGSYDFAAQKQQRPSPAGGGIVKAEWFSRYDLAARPAATKVVQSWDCASKIKEVNDYSVCTTWGVTPDKGVVLLDVYRARLEYPDLKRMVADLARRWRVSTALIEDTSAGTQLIQELKREGLHQIVAVRAEGTKEMRMRAQTAIIEQGRVWLPREAPWVNDYLHELSMFPNGKYADQVDSTSHALKFIGEPDPTAGFLEYVRAELLSRYGISSKDLTVCFDYPDPTGRFTLSNGRKIWRQDDGYYWVTEGEWSNGANSIFCVTRLD